MRRGEDQALKITISDSSGALQDIDSMIDLIVYLYSNVTTFPIIKFRKIATAGYSTLLRVSSTEYTAILPMAITNIMPVTNIYAEIEIQETDSRFTDSIRRSKGSSQVINVVNSLITE